MRLSKFVMSRRGVALTLAALCLTIAHARFAAPAHAQGPQATLNGTITDETGAVVPNVSVVAENTATTAQTRTQSNDEGFYQLPFLAPGTYRVVAERAGYARVEVREVVLAVNQAAALNIQMKVGEVTEQVTVEARGLILDTERATLGTVIDNARVSNLPLLGRNPYSLVALVPGARPSAGLNNLPVDQISTASASINGSRGNQNEYLLDGAPNSVAAQNQPAIYPSADAVQEFKVETNSYSAEYGRSAGGVFNVVTKSGANEFHGNFYDFLRNDVFDANNFFANRAGQRKPPFRFNQYGATIGGPLNFPNFGEGGPAFLSSRNRTFFFGAFEGVRLRQGVTYVGTVPTALQRQGDFSQTFNNQGQLIRIYDPAVSASNPTPATNRQAFANNRIPANRIDPVAQRLLQFLPLPNTAGDPLTNLNNFVSTASQRIDKDTFNVRVDHNFSDRQKLFGRFSFDDTPWARPDVYGTIGSPSFGGQTFKRRNFAVDDVYTLNPTTVLNGRYSWSRLSNFREPRSLGFDLAQLGFPSNLGSQIGLATLPAVTVTGMAGSYSQPNIGVATLLGVTDLIRFGMDTHSLQGSVTKTLSRHTIKVGADLRLYRFNAAQQPDTGNGFSFAPNATQGPDPTRASAAAGLGFASFLLGAANGGQVTIVPALALQQKYAAVFVQDDYKPTTKLTLNLGLRYDYETPRTDRFNQLTNFNHAARPPLNVPSLNLRGALAFAGVGDVPREQWEADRNNFAPRVGLAYGLTDSTVLRAGFGVFYAATTGVGGSAGDFGTSGFQAVTTFVGFQGNTLVNSLNNPYPNGVIQPSGSSLGAATLLGQAVNFTERERATPYAEQWNLNVQQRLPGDILFETSYAGSRGLHLPGSLVLNQLTPEALRTGRALNDQVANPFFGQIRTGILSGQTVARGQLLRPYPQFDQITSVNSHYGASTYHALLAKFDKRLSRGLNFTAAYGFSKLIDDVGSVFGGETLGGGGIQNFYDLRAERSLSTLHIPHRLVLSYIYEFPFGPNKRYLQSGVLSRVLGGWQLNGITTFQSGVPLGVAATNTTGSLGGGQRPNLVRDPQLPAEERTPQRWFDTSAFAQPDPFTFGNAPRVIPGLRADGDNVTDFSLSKRTAVGERVTIEFRAEFFNVFNTTKFSPPNTTLGSAAFGTIGSQANLPRVTQFALKLAY